METCHLLLYGNLPNEAAKAEFTSRVTNHTMVHEQMQFFLRGFRRDAHPMAILTGLVGALSAFYHDSTDINNPQHREISAIRLIAKMPTLVAMAYKYNSGQPYMYPKNNLSYAGNFLHMMFATPCEEYVVNPVIERALDRIFVLHADHEQNASTSTDPRATLMQETCKEVLAELGLENDPLFKLAMALEKIALEDDYFVQRKLYPNVDFYSGIVQRAIGIPVNMFTGVFALARTVGWIAQLNEMIGDPEYKIGRPRQLFTGQVRRDVQAIGQR